MPKHSQFFFIVALGTCLLIAPVAADVSVSVGPTAIPRGDAIGARDLTVSNDRFAVAFAVDSAPPWGVARGGIIDIAVLDNGEIGYDFASLADFMPNNWSSWPTTYQRVSVVEASADKALIRTERDWGEVRLETEFQIRDDDSRIRIVTRMHNAGESALTELQSGYVVWPDGGSLIAEPVVTTNDNVRSPGGWTAAYDEKWLLGLHAPFAEIAIRRGRDRYTEHSLAPGESKTFEAWLQIEAGGALLPMLETEIERAGLPSGRIIGHVTSNDGKAVSVPAVVIGKGGYDFAWAIGSDGGYELQLPVGDYELYATAAAYARGASRKVSVKKDQQQRLDFDDLEPPGTVHFRVAEKTGGKPLDAKISVAEGYTPKIDWFGRSTLFTALQPVGEVQEKIAPGRYLFDVSAGAGFLSVPKRIAVEVLPGRAQSLDIAIPITAAPAARGWYSADLHHHSDVLDGFTEAEYVLRSELAAGVDVAFLSDHDSVVNNPEMQRLANARAVPFIAATELSPSWGHFNAYPLDAAATVTIDTGIASVQEVFDGARSMGADVIAVNHPYSDYGYFTSHDNASVPGGYDAGFDLVEIEPVIDNADLPARNSDTLQRVFAMWNAGKKAYLAAGSDVHDVWTKDTGRARTFVHIDGELSIGKFIDSLKAGRAFASQGPLVYPEILFGSEISHRAGADLTLRYEIQAVSGLESVQLIAAGKTIDSHYFDGGIEPVAVEFAVRPDVDTWYSLIVRDCDSRSAYTNPVWVTVAK